MEKLNSLMQLIIYIHYWLLFFKKAKFKYTKNISKIMFYFFLIIYFFSHRFLPLFKLSRTKKHDVYHLYCIWYTFSILHMVYGFMVLICIGGRFLEDCFWCYSWQIVSVKANESLIPYNLINRTQETQNL